MVTPPENVLTPERRRLPPLVSRIAPEPLMIPLLVTINPEAIPRVPVTFAATV